MDNQTEKLTQSLPHFAELFEAADGDRQTEWKIVRWKGTRPVEIQPEDVCILSPGDPGCPPNENAFSSKTAALRFSADWVRSEYPKNERTEKGHWGVWKVRTANDAFYQSVMPLVNDLPQVANAKIGNGSTPRQQGVDCVRLSADSLAMIRKIAREDNQTLDQAVAVAIDEYDRQRFFQKADEAYRRLKADPDAWAEVLAERAELEGTLMDGIEDEVWDEDGRVLAGKESQSA